MNIAAMFRGASLLSATTAALVALTLASSVAIAQSSCSASNEAGAQCTITCDVGQAASCIPGSGASAPECFCTGGAPPVSSALRTVQHRLRAPLAGTIFPADLIVPPPAPVTMVDVRAAATALSAAFGPVNYSHDVTTYKTVEGPCRIRPGMPDVPWCPQITVPVTTKVTETHLLDVGQIEIVSASGLSFAQPIYTSLPEDAITSMYRAQNCQKTGTLTFSESVSVALSRTSSVTVSSSVSHTMSKSLGLSYTIYGVTINGGIQISDGDTSGTTTMDAVATSITRSAMASFPDIPPQTAKAVAFTAYKIAASIPFTSTILVDANLSPNDKGLKRLSDIASADKRTFYIRGSLDTNDASGGEIVSLDAPFDLSKCNSGQKISFERGFVPPQGTHLMANP